MSEFAVAEPAAAEFTAVQPDVEGPAKFTVSIFFFISFDIMYDSGSTSHGEVIPFLV